MLRSNPKGANLHLGLTLKIWDPGCNLALKTIQIDKKPRRKEIQTSTSANSRIKNIYDKALRYIVLWVLLFLKRGNLYVTSKKKH